MSRTNILGAGLPQSLWDKASSWAAYTKNRVPHKALAGKPPIEILLEQDPKMARTNLRPFPQKVTCYDYETKASDKLAPRSWDAHIVGYTTTFGTYQVATTSGTFQIANNPIPTKEEGTEDVESGSEHENEPTEPEAIETTHEDVQASSDEPPTAHRKKQRIAEEWEQKVGTRKSTRDRRVTEKYQIFAVGAYRNL